MAQTDGRQSQKEAVQCGAAALKKGKKKSGLVGVEGSFNARGALEDFSNGS